MPWNTSGTFAVRLSVETLTANREILWPDFDGTIMVGAGIGSGVSILTLHRTDVTAEGGEVRFSRAADDGLAWAIDCFGSGSVATALRFIDVKLGSVPMFIDQSAQSVFTNKLAVSGTAVHSGFTQLGESSPSVKMKKLTGTTGASQSSDVTVAHGLTASKILDASLLVTDAAGSRVPPSYTKAVGYLYNFHIDTTNVVVRNFSAQSVNILSRSFTVLLTYEV